MDPFHCRTEGEFLDWYKLSKQATRSLIEQMSPQLLEVHSSRGLPLPHHLPVLIALRYMATGSFQLTISDCLEVSQPSVSRCISHVSQAVVMLEHHVIKMPAPTKSLQKMEALKFPLRGISAYFLHSLHICQVLAS